MEAAEEESHSYICEEWSGGVGYYIREVSYICSTHEA